MDQAGPAKLCPRSIQQVESDAIGASHGGTDIHRGSSRKTYSDGSYAALAQKVQGQDTSPGFDLPNEADAAAKIESSKTSNIQQTELF